MLEDYIQKHNQYLKEINELDLDDASPFTLSKAEYMYSKAMLYASNIASIYRKQQRYHEAQAEIEQANTFEEAKLNGSNSTDAQYLSRRAKGEQLKYAGEYESEVMRWNGITKAYEQSINSLKDMFKSIERV